MDWIDIDELDMHELAYWLHESMFYKYFNLENVLNSPELQDEIWQFDYFCFLLCFNENAINLIKRISKSFRVDWEMLCQNENAIPILEQLTNNFTTNLDDVDWYKLCSNENAIPIIEQKLNSTNENDLFIREHIDWFGLCENPNAIDFISRCCNNEQYKNKLQWSSICSNPNPKAIDLIQQNSDKIVWYALSQNPNAIDILNDHFDKIRWDELCANTNPKAFDLLERFTNNFTTNLDKLDWRKLSNNHFVVKLYEKYWENVKHKIDWQLVSWNKHALDIIDQNRDKIDWLFLCSNPNPRAMKLLGLNKHKFDSFSSETVVDGIVYLSFKPSQCDWKFVSRNSAIVEIDNALYNLLKSAFTKMIYTL
jgi:hypothetical protein